MPRCRLADTLLTRYNLICKVDYSQPTGNKAVGEPLEMAYSAEQHVSVYLCSEPLP